MNTPSFLLLLTIPFLSFISHRLLNFSPFFRRLSPTKVALVAILLSIVLVLGFLTVLESRNENFPLCFLYSFLSAPLLGHLYFQVFNLSETARRIKLLVTLKKEGTLLLEKDYAPEQLVAIRLKRLCDLNQIKLDENVYHSRLTVLTIAAIILRSLERFMYPTRRRNT